MRHLCRPLVYGGLTFGAATLGTWGMLSKDHVWFGGSLLIVPVLFDCFLRLYGLRSKERRDARVIQMIEQQNAAMLGITTALSTDRSLAASIISLHTLNCATRDLADILATPGPISAEATNDVHAE